MADDFADRDQKPAPGALQRERMTAAEIDADLHQIADFTYRSIKTSDGSQFDCIIIRAETIRAETIRAETTGAETLSHPIHDPVAQPMRIVLDDSRGFLLVLSRVYGVDLTAGVGDICIIGSLETKLAFSVDADARARSLDELAASVFREDGLLVVRPKDGMWKEQTEPLLSKIRFIRTRMDVSDAQIQCEVFGAVDFAQLCDDELRVPIPLFVRPWRRECGLLTFQNLPTQQFSVHLRAEHLPHNRMVLCHADPKVSSFIA